MNEYLIFEQFLTLQAIILLILSNKLRINLTNKIIMVVSVTYINSSGQSICK